MSKFLLIRRVAAALLCAYDALCDRYQRVSAWSDKFFLF
jgi:hypothetical protein